MKHINIVTQFITLGQMLKFQGIITNGSEVKDFLANNDVLVNQVSENRRGRKLYDADVVSIRDENYVICMSNKLR